MVFAVGSACATSSGHFAVYPPGLRTVGPCCQGPRDLLSRRRRRLPLGGLAQRRTFSWVHLSDALARLPARDNWAFRHGLANTEPDWQTPLGPDANVDSFDRLPLAREARRLP